MTAGPLLPTRLADLPRQRTGSGPRPDPSLPDPAAGAPSQEWIHRASHRRRLELAFAILRHHGFDAPSALGPDHPADAPWTSRPRVSWSGADDRSCFTAEGRLQADLPLQVHGVLLPLLTTALAAVGLIGRLDRDTGRYVVAHGLPF